MCTGFGRHILIKSIDLYFRWMNWKYHVSPRVCPLLSLFCLLTCPVYAVILFLMQKCLLLKLISVFSLMAILVNSFHMLIKQCLNASCLNSLHILNHQYFRTMDYHFDRKKSSYLFFSWMKLLFLNIIWYFSMWCNQGKHCFPLFKAY